MATITTIQETDVIRDSREVINTNFDNLNNDKIEANSADTLTNKTIDGSNNTINLNAADIGGFDTAVSGNSAVTANTAKVSASGSIDTHSDVDTTTSAPSTNDTLTWNGSNWTPATPVGGQSLAILTGEQSTTVASGAAFILDTEDYDPDGIVTLASNAFTLAAGDYLIEAQAATYDSGADALGLYNTTDLAMAIYGTNGYSDTSDPSLSQMFVVGAITIASSKTFEMRALYGTNTPPYGSSYINNFVKITKLA